MREDSKKIPNKPQSDRQDPEAGVGFVIQRMRELCSGDPRIEKCWVDEVDGWNHVAVLATEPFYAESLPGELENLGVKWFDKLGTVTYFRVYLSNGVESIRNFIPSADAAVVDTEAS